MKDLSQFAELIGVAILDLRSKLDAANARLDALGEPVITVEAPNVEVGGTEVSIDLDALVSAIQAFSVEGVEAGLSAVAEAVSGIDVPAIDMSALVAAVEATDAKAALGTIAERIEGVTSGQAQLMQIISDLAATVQASTEQSGKVEAATQAQFTAIAEQMQRGNDAISRALQAPKRIIEEDGKPVGVETILN